MSIIKLKKGLDLHLKGEITQRIITDSKDTVFAIIPDDFQGISPKLDVKEGEKVMSGDSVFHDRTFPEICIASPVSGTIREIRRGERRKIESIIIDADGTNLVKKFDVSNAKDALLASGLWAHMRQRPYDIVPHPDTRPRDIFVTAFDSAPLAPSFKVLLEGKDREIQKGIDALASLTDGKVYVGCRAGEALSVKNAQVNEFAGPHPAGNVGIQIANVKPVNKGEVVWTLDLVTVARIGRLFATGEVPTDTIVAVTGSDVKNPGYIACTIGAQMQSLLDGNLAAQAAEERIISGNVLTGKKAGIEDFLRFPYRQVTVIPENSHPDEFMGWASLSPKKFSVHHSFLSWLLKKRDVVLDSRLKGGERAIVMAGEYDKMLPMDIYAEFLIKAIIAKDIDKMEQLGVYEIAPEDFALCEFVDTSKLEIQKIVREGLDSLYAEMN